MKIFTIVMHYETEHLTNSVLAQLKTVTQTRDVIVYDDGSAVPFHKGVEGGDFYAIWSSENMGYVKAVNNAISLVINSMYEGHNPNPDVAFWILNTDVKGLSSSMLEALNEKLYKDQSLAAVTPAVIGSPHTVMHPSPDRERYVPYIDWVAPLVRFSAWREVGGFDPHLKGFGCDVDFCKRARDKDWKFCVLPRQRIEHEMGGTTKTLIDDRGHSDLDYMNKYLSLKYGVHSWTDLKK